ncbi:MAG: TonB-dependent receptor, partial [Candidatus Omnitrophica bacterium]|nr:TonB-dependent receptor [Candidatus Omnitrophota bacterium]
MKGVVALVLVLTLLFCCAKAFAQEIELEKVVITPSRSSQDVSRVPGSITVITQEDIEASGAQTVLDALRVVPGLVVRDIFGNGAKAAVDLRGFGDAAGMNVLVLIDGRRINEIDISGVDWTQMPLERIEKIEVIRGGLGSVLYGDNASSGVINIITKKGEGKLRFDFDARGGSYNMNKENFSVSGSKDKFTYWLSASRDETDGYRRNSYYNSQDFSSKLTYEVSPEIALRFSSGFHDAGFGLPGALLETDLLTMSRRDTKYPRDHAKETDYYFALGSTGKAGEWGEISFDGSFRQRRVYANFIDANGGWNPFYKNRIDTIALAPKYVLDKDFFGKDNKLVAGFDFCHADYSADNYDITEALQNFTDINKISLGYYIQDEIELVENMIFSAGFRYEKAKYEIDFHDNAMFLPDVDIDLKPDEKAYNAAVTYNYSRNSSVFFNFSRSFRFPATDEYYTWGYLNTDLKPQVSDNFEIGARHELSPQFSLNLALFRMYVENELYYNPMGGPGGWGANENYDKTRHEGLEFAFNSVFFEKLSIDGNYTYTKAYFDGGVYSGNLIPFVPRHKASLGAKLSLPKNFILNAQVNYVGKRYFINDQANALSLLNGYVVINTSLVYKYKNLSTGIESFLRNSKNAYRKSELYALTDFNTYGISLWAY